MKLPFGCSPRCDHVRDELVLTYRRCNTWYLFIDRRLDQRVRQRVNAALRCPGHGMLKMILAKEGLTSP